MSKKFQKRIENFICNHCGEKVIGNGYTNHCPVCLWSSHVDNFPGDRENQCAGAMKPVGIFYESQVWKIIHCCQKCGARKIVRINSNDDIEALESLAKKYAGKRK